MPKYGVLTKFYVYDPAVSEGDDFGGLRARSDDNGVHVLANPMQIQYWIDQGLLGTEPVAKLGDAAKKFLAQITRGRSDDNDTKPKRVPRYSKAVQSGAPQFAGTMAAMRNKKAKTAKAKGQSKDRDIRTGQPADAKKPDAPKGPPAERPVVAPVQ